MEYLKTKPQIKDDKGLPIIIVKDIEAKPTNLKYKVSDDELYLFPVNPENKEVTVTFEILVTKNGDKFAFNNENILPGKQLQLEFKYTTFNGTILSIHEITKQP